MRGDQLSRVTIHGFKSIKSLEDLELRGVNVLVGANGAGKSNFVDLFRMVRTVSRGDRGLEVFVKEQGGADGFFYMGPKVTPEIEARFEFGKNYYELDLKPTATGLQIEHCGVGYVAPVTQIAYSETEQTLQAQKSVEAAVSKWMVYHFHDTSILAGMRRAGSVRDNMRLRDDASNSAAFLLKMHESDPGRYRLIRDTVRLMAPFFDDFLLRPEKMGENELVRLEWRQKGSDFPFQAHQLSDGTIRFIALATALHQPDPPPTLVIDEPELGLHPFAIALLAEMVQTVGRETQVILTTQSPVLLDHFDAEDIIVVRRESGASVFERLSNDDLKGWLEDYSMGDLWLKNVIQGGPTCE
jgi:predicted ATPase